MSARRVVIAGPREPGGAVSVKLYTGDECADVERFGQSARFVPASDYAAVEAALDRAINAPPAQMSWQGRLVNINSEGMREVIGAHAKAEADLAKMLAALQTARDQIKFMANSEGGLVARLDAALRESEGEK